MVAAVGRILIFSLLVVGIGKSCSEKDLCNICMQNPTAPGCAEFLGSHTCQTPPTTTTTTTTTTLPPPTTTTTTTTTTATTLPPQGAGCRAPQVPWQDPQIHGNVLRPVVMAVLKSLSGCSEGSDCPVPENMQGWQSKVTETLRDPVALAGILNRPVQKGLCAGQHLDGVSDEITVTTECGTGQRWEGYKVFACTPPRPGEPSTLDTCPIPGRGKVRWAIPTPGWVPDSCGGAPTPTPTPGPGPTPALIPGACPITITAGNWAFDLKPNGGQLLDLTPWIGNPTHTQNNPWPGCGVNRCPLSCEKGPIACECQQVLFGDHPILGTSGGPCTIIPQANPFTVKVSTGSCALFVKGSKITPSSQPWEVRATSPACNVGSNGLCQ